VGFKTPNLNILRSNEVFGLKLFIKNYSFIRKKLLLERVYN